VSAGTAAPEPDPDLTVAASPALSPPPAAFAGERFTPGSIIAGRYRLVALLGRGGMGEVYRADDLTLDQAVALKFLPGGPADAAQLARFHNELRVARQVSPKNVCRLYDLGDADGRRFLTMEYVDGEDLASLLRRIGRVPYDKALAIARQLCAGVAAAHERGVVHRDLKPANVMIDGDGNARITDFGLATFAHDAATGIIGTPQYMAPELFEGKPASVKSDLYALGLILFEIFTGGRAHDAGSLEDLRTRLVPGAVVTPSAAALRDLNPRLERAIMCCLDRAADRRPTSALSVAASLPGSDPIAEALAAGDTPSPEMLAAAGETEALPVGAGLGLLAALVGCVAVFAMMSPRATMADLVPLDKSPAVLADRAQQIVAEFGYGDPPGDSAQSFEVGMDYARWIVDTDQTADRWNRARLAAGPALLFWYRTSPTQLLTRGPTLNVTTSDPPMTEADMTTVVLDTRGRLIEFHRVPPTRERPAATTGAAPSWASAFGAAGLTFASFIAVEPQWNPRAFADARAAWEGPLPERPDVVVRVEAAAYHGRLISFLLRGPWSLETDAASVAQTPARRVLGAVATVMLLAVYGGAVLLARRNVRANRADRRSAARLTVVCVALFVAAWAVGGHHLPSLGDETASLLKVLSVALLQAVTAWVLYLALEPYGRRLWPDGLIGWTRLFAGHVRDPRIGRDILIGSALGGGLMLVDLFRRLSPRLIGRPAGLPSLGHDVSVFVGPGRLAISWVAQLFGSVELALSAVTLFVVVRLIVRNTRIAVTISIAVLTAALAANAHPGDVLWLYALSQAVAVGLATFAMFRFGLLVTAIMLVVDNIPSAVPILPRAEWWASSPGNLSMALVIALACFGFYAARAGQPLFGSLELKT